MVALGYESGCNVMAQRASRMPRPFWRQKSTLRQSVCVISLAGFRQSGYGAKGGLQHGMRSRPCRSRGKRGFADPDHGTFDPPPGLDGNDGVGGRRRQAPRFADPVGRTSLLASGWPKANPIRIIPHEANSGACRQSPVAFYCRHGWGVYFTKGRGAPVRARRAGGLFHGLAGMAGTVSD